LAEGLASSVFAKLGGEDGPEGMVEWVKHRAKVLRTGLGMQRTSMPHPVTHRRIWGQAIDVQALEQVSGASFKGCQVRGEQSAMDGKALRGTTEAGQTGGVHWLAVYGVEPGLTLKADNVLSHEHAISAAPQVLKGLELPGKVASSFMLLPVFAPALTITRQLS
jgi:hypothetical protein